MRSRIRIAGYNPGRLGLDHAMFGTPRNRAVNHTELKSTHPIPLSHHLGCSGLFLNSTVLFSTNRRLPRVTNSHAVSAFAALLHDTRRYPWSIDTRGDYLRSIGAAIFDQGGLFTPCEPSDSKKKHVLVSVSNTILHAQEIRRASSRTPV